MTDNIVKHFPNGNDATNSHFFENESSLSDILSVIAEKDAEIERLKEEIKEAKTILQDGIDREKDESDTLRILSVVAVNSIYWNNREISRLNALLESKNEECQPESKCYDEDGCPQENAVLKREWRSLNALLDKARECLVESAKMYDELSLSPLEAACKYGDNYVPITDTELLEIREFIEQVIREIGEGRVWQYKDSSFNPNKIGGV